MRSDKNLRVRAFQLTLVALLMAGLITGATGAGVQAGPAQQSGQPGQPSADQTAVPSATAPSTTIVLPDGSTCTFNDPGSIAVVDGRRLTYNCQGAVSNAGERIVLLDDPAPTPNGWAFEKAVLARDAATGSDIILSREKVLMRILRAETAAGMECIYTDRGAGAVLDGRRLNYTCATGTALGPDTVGLLGELTVKNGVFTAEMATVGQEGPLGTDVRETAFVPLAVVDSAARRAAMKTVAQTALAAPAKVLTSGIKLPDGKLCAFVGEGATLNLGGKRLDYVCETVGTDIVGLLSVSQVAPNRYAIEKATVGQDTTGKFFVKDSQLLDVNVASVETAAGASCAFVGRGATLSLDGQPVNYNCEGETTTDRTSLLGEPLFNNNTWWGVTATIAKIAPRQSVTGTASFYLQDTGLVPLKTIVTSLTQAAPSGRRAIPSATMQQPAAKVAPAPMAAIAKRAETLLVLPDKRQCTPVDESATLTVEDQPLSYTCGMQGRDITGILGEPERQGDVLMMRLATVGPAPRGPEAPPSAFTIKDSRPLTIQIDSIELADGTRCTLVSGPAPAFNGKRANYTCGSAGTDTVMLLGNPRPGNGVYQAEKALIGERDSGLYVKSSDIVTVKTLNAMSAASR